MNHPLISARYMLISTLGFALMGACVKVVGARGIPVLEIIAARAMVSLVLSFAILKAQGIPVAGNNKPLLLFRGLVGTIALFCVYMGFVSIPYAEATSIQYLNPLITAVLAAFFLKETLQWPTLLAIVMGIIGLLFITQPYVSSAWGVVESVSYDRAGYLYALAGAFGSAIAYVLVRKLSKSEDANVIILYFPLVALPLSVILLGSDFVMPDIETALLLLLVGLFTQLGQWGVTKGIETAPAGKAMSFSYLQIVFALLLGIVFFNEIPTAYTVLGIIFIVSGSLLSLLKK